MSSLESDKWLCNQTTKAWILRERFSMGATESREGICSSDFDVCLFDKVSTAEASPA